MKHLHDGMTEESWLSPYDYPSITLSINDCNVDSVSDLPASNHRRKEKRFEDVAGDREALIIKLQKHIQKPSRI